VAASGRHGVFPFMSEGMVMATRESQSGVPTISDEEILTYQEAARLLKISPRTLERWTREGLVPYIRLPQRGAWSGIRFSRNQLVRWVRQRTVKER
jgi:excisionase family DNA binding protein